ncbi:hypothetical protein IQ264_26455 [Phormidium sp. LEGE 05292]|nr:hypothetical protein [Phormidium sp. LEGE 05292]MBE9228958.1 hypothetical protein [Phormidium sp. LEGE 05292]
MSCWRQNRIQFSLRPKYLQAIAIFQLFAIYSILQPAKEKRANHYVQ